MMTIEAQECLHYGFVLGRSLGEGGFGQVKQASYARFDCPNDSLAKRLRSMGHSDQVAIKIMPKSIGMVTIKTELNCMISLSGSSNVVQLLKFFQGKEHVYFVMEFCSVGDLAHFVFKNKNIDNMKFFKEIVLGVQQCHQKNIAHRDLKLQNVLIDQNGTVKIADFGLGFILSEPGQLCDEYCGTPGYTAPEVDRGYQLLSYDPYCGFKADIYSLGVILYRLLTGKYPQKTWFKDSFFSAECRDLLLSMLKYEPQHRPSINEIANHPWFASQDEEVNKESQENEKLQMINKLVEKLDGLNANRKQLDEALVQAKNKNKILKQQLGIAQKDQILQHNGKSILKPNTVPINNIKVIKDEKRVMIENLIKKIYNIKNVIKNKNRMLVELKNENTKLAQDIEKITCVTNNSRFPNGHHFQPQEFWE
ncbi:testis-specific serine/threonine-protein kinase 5-like isoform X2 [Clytia hemisphaerica]|uniref:testis-specific serine/threonine-protein kinase 5-like isoform X2 n=1 Tax=Clytia hemisphaerica TaxID=252671 RepID=UPI0034D49D5C